MPTSRLGVWPSGFDGSGSEYNPSFRCVVLNTGVVKWSMDQFHAGSVLLAGDRLLIMRETGELMLAEATPGAFRPLARAQILPKTVRSFPALADGFFYVRNNDTGKRVITMFSGMNSSVCGTR